jgi:putative transposase
MPRPPRIIFPNACYHFLNRGNGKSTVFHEDADYRAFLALMREAAERVPMPLIAACLMPNHVHLVIRPVNETDLPVWAHWLFTKHSHRHRAKYGTTGHLWQGRYKIVPVQHDEHLLTLIRYVERNALRANLVETPEAWPWGSLGWRLTRRGPLALAECPVELPKNWRDYVHEPQSPTEIAEIRSSIARQRPFGDQAWTTETAFASGSQQSLKAPGRPRSSGNGA